MDSPSLIKEQNRFKSIISQKLNFDEQTDEDSSDLEKSYNNIGPKNLMSVRFYLNAFL